MVNIRLAQSYLKRCKIRYEILIVLNKKRAYADVIREAQEAIELLQKALLINIGMQPPKWHDVSDILIENLKAFPEEHREEIRRLQRPAKWLRSQREIAFYGDSDFIPDESYTREDAKTALEAAKKYLEIAEEIIRI